jgi:hypothetical protein
VGSAEGAAGGSISAESVIAEGSVFSSD